MKTFEKPYAAKFLKGSRVRVVAREVLVRFQDAWSLHHPLLDEQIKQADRVAVVESVGFYHGGDPLYSLQDIAGTWHECCLEADGPSPN
jgi:hypothetical protein